MRVCRKLGTSFVSGKINCQATSQVTSTISRHVENLHLSLIIALLAYTIGIFIVFTMNFFCYIDFSSGNLDIMQIDIIVKRGSILWIWIKVNEPGLHVTILDVFWKYNSCKYENMIHYFWIYIYIWPNIDREVYSATWVW